MKDIIKESWNKNFITVGYFLIACILISFVVPSFMSKVILERKIFILVFFFLSFIVDTFRGIRKQRKF